MKAIFKRIICFVLVLVTVFSMSVVVLADAYDMANEWTQKNENDKYYQLNDVYELYAVIHSFEFFSIYEATFNDGSADEGKSVYVVMCRGLDVEEFNLTKPRSLGTAVKAILSNENNPYVKAVVDAVMKNCTPGSDIVFIGHSLGGMIVEQACANRSLKRAFNILYTVTLGSPYILTSSSKEGKLIRFADSSDPVPYLSIPLLANPYLGDKVITGKSGASLIKVHFDSYSGENGVTRCWAGYDIIGNKDGGASIKLSSVVFAPEK